MHAKIASVYFGVFLLHDSLPQPPQKQLLWDRGLARAVENVISGAAMGRRRDCQNQGGEALLIWWGAYYAAHPTDFFSEPIAIIRNGTSNPVLSSCSSSLRK